MKVVSLPILSRQILDSNNWQKHIDIKRSLEDNRDDP
jgi:hypothetical protein